jgi:DnaJ-domain-containing protein 1
VVWILLLTGLVSLGLAARRASSSAAQTGGLVLLAVLAGVIAVARFGPRGLLLASPILGWFAWRALRGGPPLGPGSPPTGAGGRKPPMTREEALRVLGLREGASPEAIRDAHRNLIKKVHPDQGGSDLLAQQVNEAKRVLDSTR